ncbi:hypothetical protein ACFY05_41380 [Microtetraspora fusca]|uniref:Uncharacterized protein n=1 Tax=Microtetraspora fusca TaxID=1997 RepID=A0ABW6VNB9_MICFU
MYARMRGRLRGGIEDGLSLCQGERLRTEHRKVEDTIGSRPLLEVVRQQLGVVVELGQQARGSLADSVIDLAAQYAQFVAWMSLDVDDRAAASAWYDRAHDWALEIDAWPRRTPRPETLRVGAPIVADAVELNRHAHKELAEVATLLDQRKSSHAGILHEELTAARSTGG